MVENTARQIPKREPGTIYTEHHICVFIWITSITNPCCLSPPVFVVGTVLSYFWRQSPRFRQPYGSFP